MAKAIQAVFASSRVRMFLKSTVGVQTTPFPRVHAIMELHNISTCCKLENWHELSNRIQTPLASQSAHLHTCG